MGARDQRGIDKLRVLAFSLVLVVLGSAYFGLAWRWSYSTGERAGWVQRLSHKGWICQTWEGEMAMISTPGTATERFAFTVWNDAVAEQIYTLIGRRVKLHYEQKAGLPSSCFGDTRYYVTGVMPIEEIPLGTGIVVPTPMPTGPTAPAK